MFHARLINEASGDPGVYLEFRYFPRAVLFDLGDLHRLLPRQLLKIEHIFVSHCHMDHFIGFDHLLRICLGRNKYLHLYGPEGFLGHVENRLQAYRWNLVNNYNNEFTICATEVNPDRLLTQIFRCRDSFRPQGEPTNRPPDRLLVDTPLFTVRTEILDHGIDSLAFRFEEKDRLNIRKNTLEEMGLPKGKWLRDFKENIAANKGPDFPVRIYWREDNRETGEKWLPLGELKEKLVVIKPGQKLCYVTDALGSRHNLERILALARGVDILYIEAPFLHRDRADAKHKLHLTAKQSGTLARRAGAKRLCVFHFSPKYKGCYELLENEARAAWQQGTAKNKPR